MGFNALGVQRADGSDVAVRERTMVDKWWDIEIDGQVHRAQAEQAERQAGQRGGVYMPVGVAMVGNLRVWS